MMLEDWHLRINIQAQAVLVEVEGMKIENLARQKAGEPLAYNEVDFQQKSDELVDLARELL